MASGALTAREPRDVARDRDQTIEDMEDALKPRPARRPPGPVARVGVAPGAPCHVARSLLADNKQMIQDKQNRKLMERKSSLELHERHIQQDRLVAEGDKARLMGRRQEQKQLADHYLHRIAEKEKQKAGSYQMKVNSDADINHFPFVEGENINKDREAKGAALREELRGFLQQQRDERPPRRDQLLAETAIHHSIEYPRMSAQVVGRGNGFLSARGPPGASDSPLGAAGSLSAIGSLKPHGEEVAPHLAAYPRFLTRAQEHMSRRLHDQHVRKALEEKVQQTKNELAQLTQKKQVEHQLWEDGLSVNDALGADGAAAKAIEARKNAQELKVQMEERRKRVKDEKDEKRSQIMGYWGPEEKEVRSNNIDREHCTHIIKQMEVDQLRKQEEKNARLRQEKRLVDNCLAEMTRDRRKEAEKVKQHKEVLTTTWHSQCKIKEVYDTMQGL